MSFEQRAERATTAITGAALIGGTERTGGNTFTASATASGEVVGPAFRQSELADVEDACRLAGAAFPAFRDLDPNARADLLVSIGDEIAALGDTLIERAMIESGLPRARLEGERARTIGQLGLFASVLRDGAWLDVTIDRALPDRAPLPRPDLRRLNVALGPVAIFGASNFPLAFSVAGGDTAAALAAGCPVVVKGHPAHPGTGELVARAIARAIERLGHSAGIFSFLPGTDNALGAALVGHPLIKAVGFTGSRAGGLALVAIAQQRAEPIPVFAEMSSINPVILLPAAARTRGEALGREYAGSLTMGAGQFCTNPGIVIALDDSGTDAFQAAAAAALASAPAQHMLTSAIRQAFEAGVDRLHSHPAVERIASGVLGENGMLASASLFTTQAKAFLADRAIQDEVFGASSIIVRASDMDEVIAAIRCLEGQLTTTLLFDEADITLAQALVPLLAERSGRVLGNGWPTGVEVCHAMVHGGPYPAASDPRTTSVGALAIARFVRPVCYQNLPDALLPPALRDDDSFAAPRRVDGRLENGRAIGLLED